MLSTIDFANASLAQNGHYPDDFDFEGFRAGRLPSPNEHTTTVSHAVLLDSTATMTLRRNGLQFVDLQPHLPGLSALLGRVVSSGGGPLGPDGIAALKRAFVPRSIWLPGSSFLDSGRLHFLHAAVAGVRARAIGPGGSFGRRSEHAWVPLAHTDQDARGEPIRSLLCRQREPNLHSPARASSLPIRRRCVRISLQARPHAAALLAALAAGAAQRVDAMLCYAVLYAMLRYAMLRCAMLCCAMLCYATLGVDARAARARLESSRGLALSVCSQVLCYAAAHAVLCARRWPRSRWS